jgi:hypothetical protein
MSARTSPTDSIEQIAWHLNYHDDETVSLNYISEATGLSWATVQKYTKMIEVLNRISPEMSVEDEGIKVERKSENLEKLPDGENLSVVMYVMIHAEMGGSVTQEITTDKHAQFFEEHEEKIGELEKIGWLEETENGTKLTQKGIRIAGQARSKVRNTNISSENKHRDRKAAVDSGEDVYIVELGEIEEDTSGYTSDIDSTTNKRVEDEEKTSQGYKRKALMSGAAAD